MLEDRKLKRYLVFQSFCPLFILIFIRHVGHIRQISMFISGIFSADTSVFFKAIHSNALGHVVITLISVVWIILTVVVAAGFCDIQKSGFDHHGEIIIVENEKKDSGVNFLVGFILPIIVEDVETLRGFVYFIVLLCMLIFLLVKSDMFYQNPILTALKYRCFEFRFSNPYSDVEGSKTYIGIAKKDIPNINQCIKRRYIADGVFFICNER